MDEKIASDARAIFLPAAPAGEGLGGFVGIPRALGENIVLPCIPVEILRREVQWGRIFPSAIGIVPAHGAFNQHQIADYALADEFLGFCADNRANPL